MEATNILVVRGCFLNMKEQNQEGWKLEAW